MPVTARLLLRGLRASLRVCFLAGAAGIALAQGQATGSVDLTTSLNRVDGFGFSAAFGQAETLRKLDPKTRAEVLNLLFGRDGGAGLNIVRLGIDTGTTIEPADPGGPSAAPKYVFDGSDGGQVWLAQAAQRFGVATFTADAWTAPAFMKTNQKVVGGSLCGLAETHCAADWTRAFADYLLRYVGFYRDLLIPIDSLGFANEPDINVSYESMLFRRWSFSTPSGRSCARLRQDCALPAAMRPSGRRRSNSKVRSKAIRQSSLSTSLPRMSTARTRCTRW
jgi:glucosylceramidase